MRLLVLLVLTLGFSSSLFAQTNEELQKQIIELQRKVAELQQPIDFNFSIYFESMDQCESYKEGIRNIEVLNNDTRRRGSDRDEGVIRNVIFLKNLDCTNWSAGPEFHGSILINHEKIRRQQ